MISRHHSALVPRRTPAAPAPSPSVRRQPRRASARWGPRLTGPARDLPCVQSTQNGRAHRYGPGPGTAARIEIRVTWIPDIWSIKLIIKHSRMVPSRPGERGDASDTDRTACKDRPGRGRGRPRGADRRGRVHHRHGQASPTPSSSHGSGLVVTTAEGAVREDGAAADEFLGIPYAAPPVGALRWQPPRPPARWPGVRAAVSYAPHCPRPSSPFGRASTSEDCLYLNVFTPAGARTRNLPVMVWVHGGSLAPARATTTTRPGWSGAASSWSPSTTGSARSAS